MKIVGICPVRNEDWCLGLTLRAALQWCDEVIVLDHASTDRTETILSEIDDETEHKRLFWFIEPDPLWREMNHRQRLLTCARSRNATHIAMIDADELLTANLIPHIRTWIERLGPMQMLCLPWICVAHMKQGDYTTYMSSGMWAKQRVSTAFLDRPQLHWTTANGYDFHHRAPYGCTWHDVPMSGGGGLLHLQFLSTRRLYAKQYLYQLTERLRWPDREPVAQMSEKYSLTVREALAAQTAPCPANWFAGYEDLLHYLQVDAEPWQEAECRRLLKEHPGIGEGCNLFGLSL